MHLNKFQFDALASFVRGKSNQEIGIGDRLALASLDPSKTRVALEDIERPVLQRTIALLPKGATGRIRHPILVSVRDNMKAALRLKRPAFFGGKWPRSYRFITKMNLARAGLRDGPMLQTLSLHPKAMAVSLNDRFVWSERNSGDLVIMGRRSEIAKAITDAGQALRLTSAFETLNSDVNSEYDEMYGSMPGDDPTWNERKDDMPLFVGIEPGAKWEATDNQGEVVLNPLLDVAQLFIGRTAGVAGAAAPLPDGGKGIAVAATGAVKDLTGMIAPHVVEKIQNAQAMKRLEKSDDTVYTVTVGVTPNGKEHVTTDEQSIGGETLLRHVQDLLRRLDG